MHGAKNHAIAEIKINATIQTFAVFERNRYNPPKNRYTKNFPFYSDIDYYSYARRMRVRWLTAAAGIGGFASSRVGYPSSQYIGTNDSSVRVTCISHM